MHPNPRRIIPVVLVVALLALAYWYFEILPAQNAGGKLTASGTIVMTQVQVGPELGGKATAVNVEEGDMVKAGDTLVQLDATLLKVQRSQASAALAVAQANAEVAKANQDAAQYGVDAAQAAVDAAQAGLDLLQAGASPDQLAAAEAQLAQAEANRQAVEASLSALTAGARPEDVASARLRLDLARQEYFNLSLVLSADQISATLSASTAAQDHLAGAKARLDELKKDAAMPATALEAAAAALQDAGSANQAAQNALKAVQNPALPFYQQIEAARQCWDTAQLNLSQAQVRKDALLKESSLPQAALDAASAAQDDAQNMLEEARAAYDALSTSSQGDRLRAAWNNAQSALSDLNSLGRSAATPLETALNQLDASSALRDLASANLSQAKSGSRSQQVEAANAQLSAAKAQLSAAQARSKGAAAQTAAASAQAQMAQAAIDVLDAQIAKMTISAPVDGVVLTRNIQPGEIALPSATLIVLGRTDDKTLTVYVPEDRYGAISVGQEATVRVDSFPGQSFQARVITISDKAEFTPRNVQTVEGRKNTVFAIRLQLIDPDDRLKAGMPADVEFK